MSGSKFVEILDAEAVPYNHGNVSLDDVLAETRQRSASSSSTSSTNGASSPTSSRSPERSSSSSPIAPFKSRMRGLSLKESNTTTTITTNNTDTFQRPEPVFLNDAQPGRNPRSERPWTPPSAAGLARGHQTLPFDTITPNTSPTRDAETLMISLVRPRSQRAHATGREMLATSVPAGVHTSEPCNCITTI
ncbi:hypothetical protein K431DRAFT_305412 [Polychaeton citri CBS 116435]|uniref:Uncharacterized protein n=1 Tax=Polychaeton citri CBS 116435 TaxID=1314669 RepID=A0A9P4Q687_9PEZI|nr:hypothetical protein K431DRAFT_305412 [Polychaeton citri CBS 116435]